MLLLTMLQHMVRVVVQSNGNQTAGQQQLHDSKTRQRAHAQPKSFPMLCCGTVTVTVTAVFTATVTVTMLLFLLLLLCYCVTATFVALPCLSLHTSHCVTVNVTVLLWVRQCSTASKSHMSDSDCNLPAAACGDLALTGRQAGRQAGNSSSHTGSVCKTLYTTAEVHCTVK